MATNGVPLTRVVLTTFESLRPFVASALEARHPVSVIIGLHPALGAVRPNRHSTRLSYFRALANSPARLHIGLCDSPEPLPSRHFLPDNLVLYRGGLETLANVHDGPFVDEVISYGAHSAGNLRREELLALRSVMVVEASLRLYLLADRDESLITRLENRVARAGFHSVEVANLTDASNPLPSWPKPLRRTLTARTMERRVPDLPERDPWVVAVRQAVAEDVDFHGQAPIIDPWVLWLAASWLKDRFPKTLWEAGDYDRIRDFCRRQLPTEAEIEFQRDAIVNGACRVVQGIARLFSKHGPVDRVERRRAVVQALAIDFITHNHPPYSYAGLLERLTRTTGLSERQLDDFHRPDYVNVLWAVARDWDIHSRPALRRAREKDSLLLKDRGWTEIPEIPVTKEEIEAVTKELLDHSRGSLKTSDLWRQINSRLAVSIEDLRSRFEIEVMILLWQHYGRLSEVARKELAGALERDEIFEGMAARRFQPPYDLLPERRKVARLRQWLAKFLVQEWREQGHNRPLSAPGLLTRLHGKVVQHDIPLSEDLLRQYLSIQARDIIWRAIDMGILEERFATAYRIQRPTPVPSGSTPRLRSGQAPLTAGGVEGPTPPSVPSAASGVPASRVDRPPPPPPPPRPRDPTPLPPTRPSPRQDDDSAVRGRLESDLAKFLARRGGRDG